MTHSTTELNCLCKVHACSRFINRQHASGLQQKTICTCQNKCPRARLNNQHHHSPISSQVHVMRSTTEPGWLYNIRAYLCFINRNGLPGLQQKMACTCHNKCPKARLNSQRRHSPISSQVHVTRSTTKPAWLYNIHVCLCFINRNGIPGLRQKTVCTCKKTNAQRLN